MLMMEKGRGIYHVVLVLVLVMVLVKLCWCTYQKIGIFLGGSLERVWRAYYECEMIAALTILTMLATSVSPVPMVPLTLVTVVDATTLGLALFCH